MNKPIKCGEIYLANLSPVLGSEERGVRPVVIIQNDKGNIYSPTVIVAAITSNIHKHCLSTHVMLHNIALKSTSLAMLEQIKTIDRSRIIKYIGVLDVMDIKKINSALKISLEL